MVCGTHRSALCARRCQHVPRTVSVPADTSHVIVQIRLASFTLGQFRQHRVRWTRSGRQSLPYYALLYTSSAMFAVSGAVDDPTREARIALVSKLGPPPGYRLLRLVPVARPHLRLSHHAGKHPADAVSPRLDSIRVAFGTGIGRGRGFCSCTRRLVDILCIYRRVNVNVRREKTWPHFHNLPSSLPMNS